MSPFDDPESRIRSVGGRTERPGRKSGGLERNSESGPINMRPQGMDGPLECVRLLPVGANNIQPRPWAYGHFLMFGTAGVIGAVDGGGKSAISVAMMLAMITGEALLGEKVWRIGPVAIVTYEDDETEWHRRIAAACIHYGLDFKSVLGKIHFIIRRGGRIYHLPPRVVGESPFLTATTSLSKSRRSAL